MRPDHQELADGLRLAAIAVVSAGVMAAMVIGLGRVVLPQQQVAAGPRGDVVFVALRRPAS